MFTATCRLSFSALTCEDEFAVEIGWMGDLQVCAFTVPIHCEGGAARVYVLWPCSALELGQFMMREFAFDSGERDSWEGKCVTDPQVDAKHGCPTAVIALRKWELTAANISWLAHECFHAAEWILMQSGHRASVVSPSEQWEAGEDMAYLLQRIVCGAIERLSGLGILSNQAPSSPKLAKDKNDDTGPDT